MCFKPALNSKGLRLCGGLCCCGEVGLQASPEFKGIKTEGAVGSGKARGFKPALNSKGLRQMASVPAVPTPLQASPEFKGIKTGVIGR